MMPYIDYTLKLETYMVDYPYTSHNISTQHIFITSMNT